MISMPDFYRMRVVLMALLFAPLLTGGCEATFPPSVDAILNNGDSYQLMLTHKNFVPDQPPPAPQFQGCFVDKTVTLTDTSSRRKLVAALGANLTDGGSTSAC